MRLSTRQQSQGKDMLWELELLRSLRIGGVAVRLEEPPDLVVGLDGLLGDYGIACKKIYSEKGVGNRLKEGCDQLRRTGMAGIVAFNLDDILTERAMLSKKSHEEAFEALVAHNKGFLDRNLEALQSAVMAGGCDGVLMSTTVPAEIYSASPSFNRVRGAVLFTIKQAGAAAHIRIASLQRQLNWMLPDQ